MSMDLMVKAMKIKVGNSGRKLVLLKLADNANDSGECWPSYQYIADQCEMGRRTVIDHIKRLEKDGFLSKSHRNSGKSSNVYTLDLDAPERKKDGAKTAPVEICTSAKSAPPSAESAPLTSAKSAPRTSHSFEPVNESKKNKQKNSGLDISRFTHLVSEESLKNWIAHRKAIKKPMSQRALHLSIKNFLKVADELSLDTVQQKDGAEVHPVDQLIDYTIEAGWQSVKSEWVINREAANQKRSKQNGYAPQLAAEDLGGEW